LKYPEVRSLRDISLAMLKECIPITSDIYKRCSCIVKEIGRVVSAVDAISKKDLVSLGTLLYEAHDELSHLYEVSCKELDYLVDTVQQMEGVIGARMMGGGFGGCTLNLIHKDFVSSITTGIKASYEADCKLPFHSFIVSIGDGVKLISN
jgi:galactokinase